MSDDLKYVIFGGKVAIIFSNVIVHKDMARGANIRLPVTSAGFCRFWGDAGWDVWGRSESLNIASMAGDGELLNLTFTPDLRIE